MHVALEFAKDVRAEACLASLMPSSHLGPDFLRAFFLAFDHESFPVVEESKFAGVTIRDVRHEDDTPRECEIGPTIRVCWSTCGP